MLKIKRVKLGGKASSSSSRHGLYYRVKDTATGRSTYYKATAKVKSKNLASIKYAVTEQKRLKNLELSPKKLLNIDEKNEVLELEDATLHFRIDYNVGDARPGHAFQMRDSHVTAKIPRGMSDTEAKDYLAKLFHEAFSHEFGGALSGMIDEESLVQGLERGAGNSEGVRIKYNYGGGRGWKEAHAKLGTIHDLITDKENFFYKTLKRKRK